MSDKNSPSCGMKFSGIGGQAVMEGVMMRNKEDYAVAVRKPDGEMAVVKGIYKGIMPLEISGKIPVLRGIVGFVDSLVLGMKALNYSADFYAEEPGEEKNAEKPGEEKSAGSGPAEEEKKDTVTTMAPEDRNKSNALLTTVVMIVAVFLAMGLFMVIPYYTSLLFSKWIASNRILALIEGLIRLGVFVIYIKSISAMEDIKRVFRYHGAEHKCINCLESGKELTLENVRSSSREHKRCGTSFLLYVMVVSILIFAFIDFKSRLIRAASRILLIPLIAGISYEFIRLAGRSNNPFILALSAPGLMMQRLTTAEPDDEMIKVGMASVEAVFDWREFLKENFGTSSGSEEKNPSE